ncbi:MAG TPA: hypothetical protein VK466_07910 [Terriglobales bacterium]|nr:hypothetical protein [Terriglobales bacterium]
MLISPRNFHWVFLLLLLSDAAAQDWPYFVTYSHALEEPGNLEIEFKGTQGSPKYGNSFVGGTIEFEYGVKGWWTSELYLSGQHTSNDSTVFTGFRWENRFRPLLEEHFINPVLYVEYENVNEADRSFLEVVGHDNVADLRIPNAESRNKTERALELKLILSRNAHGWNYSGNFIAEKTLNESEPWEFGYAAGVSRPLAFAASPQPCLLCRENFAAGAELYGGLGTADGFGLRGTSHYLGPTVAFSVPSGPAFTFSPVFGLNDNSLGVLYRFKISYEIEQIFGRLRRSSR